MLRTFFKNWWILTLKGILMVAFAIFCFAYPGLAITSLALWFSLLLIADGVLSLVAVSLHWKDAEDKWLLVIEGALLIFLGMLLWRRPDVTLLLISMFIAIWAFLSGISRIAMAIQFRKEIEGEFWLALSGLLYLVLGILVIARPVVAVASLAWLIGFVTLFLGGMMILFSLKVRKGKTLIREKIDDLRKG